MSSELKTFHSLNCSLCKAPYPRSSNDPKYPCQLLCGKAICKECWEKEKPLKIEEKKHQCDEWLCYSPSKFPSFLHDVLNDPSIIESPNGNGWLLSEPITNPLKCSKCDVKYSMGKDENKPVVLKCGHAMCTKCYWVKCSICDDSDTNLRSRENWLREFLLELPEMIEQIPKVKPEKQNELKRTCGDCEKEAPLFEMFQCNDCGKVMLCALCGMKKHHSHKVVDLEVVEVMNATYEVITPQIKAYDVCFPELQADLIENIHNFQAKALEKAGKIEGLNYDPAEYEKADCLAIAEEFEGICEKYLGDLRSCNTGIEKLLSKFNDAK